MPVGPHFRICGMKEESAQKGKVRFERRSRVFCRVLSAVPCPQASGHGVPGASGSGRAGLGPGMRGDLADVGAGRFRRISGMFSADGAAP